MRTKTIEYDSFGVQANVTIAQANVAMGLERSSLADEAMRQADVDRLRELAQNGADLTEKQLALVDGKPPQWTYDERIMYWLRWPAMRVGIVEGKVAFLDDDGEVEREIDLASEWSFEDFLELPEELTIIVLGDILALNPHWDSRKEDDSPGKQQSGAASKTNSDAA